MYRFFLIVVFLSFGIPNVSHAIYYNYGESPYYSYSQSSYYSYAQASYYSYAQATYYSYAQSTYYSYSQSAYYSYSQSTYYGQTTYQTTFSKNASELLNFAVTGLLTKAAGTFVIDHPLDPKNKLLYHSFVESPEVKNIYDGIITLDNKGEARVVLPGYFDALNTDVRYQLKPIGAPMPDLHVKSEEKNNQFEIGGGIPRARVSWQVTGIRHDPYILANPIVPEVNKGEGQIVGKGEYLYPAGYPESAYTLALPGAWQPLSL